MSQDLLTQIAALKAENEALKNRKVASHGIKVSPKGAVSVYGLGRFPVTLYASQWETLFTKQEDVKSFITTNLAALASKPTQETKPQA